MNYGEGEQLSDKMHRMGHERVYLIDDADMVVLNTCIVVDTTEKKMIRRLADLKKTNKEIIITGCMAKVQPNRIKIRLPESVVVPPDNYDSFEYIISNKYGHTSPIESTQNDSFGILPIAQGCLGNCTYCVTKLARGNLKSYPENELISIFKKMVKDGKKEILITAQDTAAYGADTGTNLVSLISLMLEVKGEYRIRIGMMNPNNLENIISDLVTMFDDTRVYKFLHIPVQSGSNTILEAMNRQYTVEAFMNLVNNLRLNHPDISISTDLISGFPEETEEDHMLSENLIRALKADTINITRFSPRPKTEAFNMPPVHGRIAKERSTALTKIKNDVEYEVNKKLIGKRYLTLITERGKNNTVIGRNINYRPIAIIEDLPLGLFVEIEITNCTSTYLFGRTLNN